MHMEKSFNKEKKKIYQIKMKKKRKIFKRKKWENILGVYEKKTFAIIIYMQVAKLLKFEI